MADKNISVSINAKDNTKSTLDGIKKNLGGLESAAKSFTAIFAAEKIKQFFTEAIKAGTEADTGLKKSFTQIGDAYRGFQVATARAFLGNESLMSSLKSLILSVGPAVIKSFQVIVNTILLVVNGYRQLATVASLAWNAIRGKDNADNFKNLNRLAEESKILLSNYGKIVTADVSITPVAAPSTGSKAKTFTAKDTSAARRALGQANTPQVSDIVAQRVFRGKESITDRIDVSRDDQEKLAADQKRKLSEAQQSFLEQLQAFDAVSQSAISNFAASLGNGIGNAFASAFSGASLGSVFKDFGKVVLSGLGAVFTQFGQTLISFGASMLKLRLALTNPITSGPAAIAAGIALVALGGVLGGIANGGGSRGVSSVASFGNGSVYSNTQQGISAGNGTPIIVKGGFLNLSDPIQAKAFADAVQAVTGRRITVQRG